MTRPKSGLADMIDRMARAERASNPMESLRILTGWTCQCGKEFQPDPKDQPILAVKMTAGLPIYGPCCTPKEGT